MNHLEKKHLLRKLAALKQTPVMQAAIAEVAAIESDGRCDECLNFNTRNRHCAWWATKEKPAIVPKEHIARGCEAWVGLPF